MHGVLIISDVHFWSRLYIVDCSIYIEQNIYERRYLHLLENFCWCDDTIILGMLTYCLCTCSASCPFNDLVNIHSSETWVNICDRPASFQFVMDRWMLLWKAQNTVSRGWGYCLAFIDRLWQGTRNHRICLGDRLCRDWVRRLFIYTLEQIRFFSEI